jgi:hypothetical protein
MGLDTTTPTGELILQVLGSIAQFERAMMLERQREGIAKAKAEGKYKGRKPTARTRAAEVRELHAQGVGAVEIAKRLGIGRSSVYRAIADDPLAFLDDAIDIPALGGIDKELEELDRLLAVPTDIPGLDDIDKDLDRLPL